MRYFWRIPVITTNEKLIYKRKLPITFWIGEVLRGCTIFGLPFAIANVSSSLTSSVQVTDKRIFGISGKLGSQNFDISYDKIYQIEVKENTYQKIWNYGELIIISTSGEEFSIICESPTIVKKEIFILQDQYKYENESELAIV